MMKRLHLMLAGLVLLAALFFALASMSLQVPALFRISFGTPEFTESGFAQVLFFVLLAAGAFFTGRAAILLLLPGKHEAKHDNSRECDAKHDGKHDAKYDATHDGTHDRMVFPASVFLGFGIAGFIAMLSGLAGQFTLALPLFGVIAAASLLFLLRKNALAAELPAMPLALAAGMLALSALLAAAFPILSPDAWFYHAEMSRILFQEHAFPQIAGTGLGLGISSNYPPLFPSLGALALPPAGASSGASSGPPGDSFNDFGLRLVSRFIALFLALPLFILSKKLFRENATALFFFFWALANLFIVINASSCYPLLFAFFVLSFHYWLAFLESKSPGALALSSLFFGFSLLCSYLALALAPVFLVFWLSENKYRLAGWRAPCAFFLIALLLFSPWAVRTFLLTGDPIYPAIASLFAKPGSPLHVTVEHLAVSTLGSGIVSRMQFFFTILPFPLFGAAALLFSIRAAWKARPGLRESLTGLLSGPYALWFLYPLPLLLIPSFVSPKYAVLLLLPAAHLTARAFGSLRNSPQLSFAFRFMCMAVVLIATLAFLLPVHCLFCGYEAVRMVPHGNGMADFFVAANSLQGRIAAFDMPTYYLSEGRQKIIAIDEGAIFSRLAAADSNQAQACILKQAGADYVLLPLGLMPQEQFAIQLFQNLSNPKLVPVMGFHGPWQNASQLTLYRISGCG